MASNVEKLIAARSLIEKGWTQGATSRSAKGRMVRPTSALAVSYCAVGAIRCATQDVDEATNELCWLLRRPIDNIIISEWNDAPERTKADVLAAFDRAIELAREPELVA